MADHKIGNERDAIDFLYFGFIPRLVNTHFDIYHILQQKKFVDKRNDTKNARYYIKRGIKQLNKVFDNALESIGQKHNHLILLSGGLDSRAILGALLERVDSTQIQTITFGTPGTLDYEIGKRVAKHAGVKHFSLDLTNSDWNWREIEFIQIAKRMEQPIQLFDTYVNQKIPEFFGEDYINWNGFMGGTSIQPEIDSPSWEQAKALFVREKKYVKSMGIYPHYYNPIESLPLYPFCDSNVLSFDDQLHFMRQNLLTRNNFFRKDYQFCTPFYNVDWINFFSEIPKNFRFHCWIYKEILRTAYPKLFSLPVKNYFGFTLDTPIFLTYPKRAGLKIKRLINKKFPMLYLGPHQNINYIDFDEGLRKRHDLRELVEKNLQDLKTRDLVTWLNLEKLWDLHKRRKANYADALLILTALEFYMKVEEKI